MKISYTNNTNSSAYSTNTDDIIFYLKQNKIKAKGVDFYCFKSNDINAQAGTNINSVGTPSVTSSIKDGVYTLTFNYLKGEKGDSLSVKSSTTTYTSSTSGTTTPSSGWSSSIPSVNEGSYLWSKTVISYSSGESSILYQTVKQPYTPKLEYTASTDKNGGENKLKVTIGSTSNTYSIYNGLKGDTGNYWRPSINEGIITWTDSSSKTTPSQYDLITPIKTWIQNQGYALKSDITDYYWANIKISNTSSTETTPTFKTINISDTVVQYGNMGSNKYGLLVNKPICHTGSSSSSFMFEDKFELYSNSKACTFGLNGLSVQYGEAKFEYDRTTTKLFQSNVSIQAPAFYESSDARLKENVKDITDLEKAKNIQFKEFNLKEDSDKKYGVIALDLEKIGLSNLVKDGEYKSVDYISLLCLKIAQLEEEIKLLKSC